MSNSHPTEGPDYSADGEKAKEHRRDPGEHRRSDFKEQADRHAFEAGQRDFGTRGNRDHDRTRRATGTSHPEKVRTPSQSDSGRKGAAVGRPGATTDPSTSSGATQRRGGPQTLSFEGLDLDEATQAALNEWVSSKPDFDLARVEDLGTVYEVRCSPSPASGTRCSVQFVDPRTGKPTTAQFVGDKVQDATVKQAAKLAGMAAGGAVGAAVGFYTGGPAGAVAGAKTGARIGGWTGGVVGGAGASKRTASDADIPVHQTARTRYVLP
jgi:hypothetical protein